MEDELDEELGARWLSALARARLRSARRHNAVVDSNAPLAQLGIEAGSGGRVVERTSNVQLRASKAESQRTSNAQRSSKAAVDEARMREILISAQAQGRMLERRVQLPSLGLAILCAVLMVILSTALPRTPMTETFVIVLGVLAAICVLFSASVGVVVMSVVAMCFGVLIVALVVINLHRTRAFRTCSGSGECCGLGTFAAGAGLLFGEPSCWYLWYHLRWRLVVRAAAGALISLRVGVLFVSRMRPRALLLSNWRTIGYALVFIVIGDCFTAASMVALGLIESNGVEFALTLTRILVVVVLAAFSLMDGARQAVHRWLASRGETVSTAVGIASLIGSRGVDDVQQQALSTLRSIRLDALRKTDFECNSPSVDLFARSAPARFGEIDAFVSHSWRDDAVIKWEMLMAWGAEFKRLSADGREPTIWFDRACIDPTASDMDTQLALLPIWCASCNSFVMLFTPTLLTRLWCVVELFVWMHVGDTQAIVVCDSDYLHSQASHGEQAAHAISVDQQPRRADAQPHAARTAPKLLEPFDVRKAECFGNDTRARLLSVIEVGCGSLDAFSAVASSVLAARLDAQDVLIKLRAGNQQAHNPMRFLSGTAKRSRSQHRSASVVPVLGDATASPRLSSLRGGSAVCARSADERPMSELSSHSHANGGCDRAAGALRTERAAPSTRPGTEPSISHVPQILSSSQGSAEPTSPALYNAVTAGALRLRP